MQEADLKYSWPKLKIQLSTIVFAGILIQILSTQGILMYDIFYKLGNWEIKKVLHPVGIIFILLLAVYKLLSLNLINLKIESILLFSYLFLQYTIQFVFNKVSLPSFLYSFRELLLIFLLISSYQLFALPNRYKEYITKILLVFTILNIIFVLLTFYLGPESYMKLLTGRYYWPIDPELKFKISTFMGKVYRSPGLIGESASLGFFGLFSFFFVFHSKYKKFYWLSIILIVLSFTRSAYLVIIIYGVLNILSKKKNLKLAINISPLLIGIFLYANYIGLFSLLSFWMRIDNWFTKVKLNSNLLFGGNLDNIGAAAHKGSGFASILDSYWLYLFHGIGLMGIVLVIFFLFKKFNSTRKVKLFLISLMISGFFISFNQSIPFLVFFPLLSISNWWVEDNDYIY